MRRLYLVIGFFSVVLVTGLWWKGWPSVGHLSESSRNAGSAVLYVEEGGVPVRLKIPKIHVDTVIEGVGNAPDGSMDVPKSPQEVAWYQLGSRPGALGSAVIAGHYRWADGEPSIFDEVHTLVKGDLIFVENDAGETLTFSVREIKSYDPMADTEEVFGSTDGISHLNLVTCAGSWQEASKSYSERLVVFADREIRVY